MHFSKTTRPISILQLDAYKLDNQTHYYLAIGRTINLQSDAYKLDNQTMSQPTIYPRYIESRLAEALEDSPIVLIHGPRQSGKTTLAQFACAPANLYWGDESPALDGLPLRTLGTRNRDYEYISFDDDNLLAGAREDPVGFVADLPERVILDEAQRAPEIFTALKLTVDRNRTPGRFVLTGSSNILLLPTLADSLAGRMETVHLHPLSQDEIEAGLSWTGSPAPTFDTRSGFLDALFGGRFEIRRSERLGTSLRERIVRGGFPPAIARATGPRRAAWYRNYADAHVQRDVRDLARIRGLETLPELLNAAAAQTASLYNLSDLAAPFQLSRQTIGEYVTLLERVFLIERLKPWHSNRLSRLVKTPKLHIGDTGLGCALLGLDEDGLASDRGSMGWMLETFVYQELRRQASWNPLPTSFFHYRDKDKVEVDIVLERGPRAVAGVEIKAAATIRNSDFRGLRKLSRLTGERFAAGILLYDGETTVNWGDGMYAIPIRRLWETSLQPSQRA